MAGLGGGTAAALAIIPFLLCCASGTAHGSSAAYTLCCIVPRVGASGFCSKDNSADESLEKNSMDQGDFMVEFVEDTMDQVVEDSMEDEENDSFGEFDEDSMEYLRGRVVEDSKEENNKDEAYLKVKKEVDLRSARDDALRREAKAKNAPRHKRRMKKIFTDFMRIYVPPISRKEKK